MPGREFSELLAYLHVLINHKMSPRGRTKPSISATSTSPPSHIVLLTPALLHRVGPPGIPVALFPQLQ